MKRIAGITIKQNVPKVLIHPYTPIYLRFCRFVAWFVTPIMCNKTRGGVSAKKTGGIALAKLTPYSPYKNQPPIALKKTNPLCVLGERHAESFQQVFNRSMTFQQSFRQKKLYNKVFNKPNTRNKLQFMQVFVKTALFYAFFLHIDPKTLNLNLNLKYARFCIYRPVLCI